jgi:hypothetical protein
MATEELILLRPHHHLDGGLIRHIVFFGNERSDFVEEGFVGHLLRHRYLT